MSVPWKNFLRKRRSHTESNFIKNFMIYLRVITTDPSLYMVTFIHTKTVVMTFRDYTKSTQDLPRVNFYLAKPKYLPTKVDTLHFRDIAVGLSR